MVDLPGALLSFSQTAVRNINGLDAITSSLPNPQTAVQSNISNSVSSSITSNPMFSNVPGPVSAASQSFTGRLTNPPDFSASLQQSSFQALFGSFLTSGPAVDGFLNANVRLEDVIPSQQLYNIVTNLGVSSLYADPVQAYVQVQTASRDLCNLCQDALSVIGDITDKFVTLLSVQRLVDYSSVQQMDFAFFAQAKGRAAVVQANLSIVVDTFYKRGRFDPDEVGAFCAAANALTEFVSFADTKLMQIADLKNTLTAAFQRLALIGDSIAKILASIVGYVPSYISAVTFGKVFQAVQGKVLDLAGVDIQGILSTLEALSYTSVDDRTKLGAIFNAMGSLEVIRAFICYLSPGTDVKEPTGPFGNLKAAYDGFTAGLTANDPTALIKDLQAHIGVIIPMMNTATTQDNASELSTEWAIIGAILTPLALFLSNCCNAANIFSGLFKQETAGMGDRLTGVDSLYTETGLDANREAAMSAENLDEIPDIPQSKSTTPGQLAEEVAKVIEGLPESHRRDQLTEVHDRLLAQHRDTVLSMDNQRRQETALTETLTQAEELEKIVREEVERYG